MPLDKVEIRVPFGGGVDTKTDSKQVIPGKLLTLKNGTFQNLKQITKREAFETPYALTTVGWYAHGYDTIKEGATIYRRGNELLITARQEYSNQNIKTWEDGWYVYSHDPTNNEWKNIGTRQPLRLGVETIVEPTLQWKIPDVALADNARFACYGWLAYPDPADATTSRTVRVTIVDLLNNATIIDQWNSDVSIGGPGWHMEGVHVTGIDATNSVFYVWIASPSTNDIYMSMTDTTSMHTLGLPVVKISDLDNVTPPLWDACTAILNGTGTCSVIAYQDNSTPANINVRWFNEFGNEVLLRTIDDTPKGAITVFQAYDDEQAENMVVVSWQSTSDNKIYAQTYDQDGVAYAGPFVVNNLNLLDLVRNITGCRDTAADAYVANSSFCRFYVECANDAANSRPDSCIVRQTVCEFDGTNLSVEGIMRRCCLGSKAWEYEDQARVWVVHDSAGLLDFPTGTDDIDNPQIQNTYFLRSTQGSYQTYAIDPGDRVDARCLGNEAGGQGERPSLSAVVSPSSGRYLFAGLRKDIITNTQTGEAYDSVVGINTYFGEVAQPAVEMGPTTQTGGGFVGDADGRFQELGFHLYPECLIATVNTIGAGAAVNRQYCVVYEWTDREGQRHQSAPSIPVGVGADYGQACTDTDSVDIDVAGLAFGDPERLAKIRCVLYRTVDGGDVFYRLPNASPAGAVSPHQLNNPHGTVTLYDCGAAGAESAFSDAAIQECETLYTTGGVVPNICPPASSIMNVRQDRVFLVPDDDRTNIWFSKIKRDEMGVSFSDYFTKRVSDGGEITGLITMDTREIVFKKSEIRAFSGTGPIDTGTGSFGEDYMITSDVGCCDRASIVWTDKGIMFKSLKGIYLLGRNLQVTYVGAPVEEYNQYTVLKAELVETKNQVRFLLEDNVAMLVYDYLVDQWSVFDSPYFDEVQQPWGTIDSAMWQNRYVMIRSDGTVLLETADYQDITDTYIPLDLTTAWIKLSGLQGYQRVFWYSLLGKVYDYCTINYEIYYNYIDANPQTGSVVVDAEFAANPPAQFRIKPRYGEGKCQAFKIRLYDATAAGATNYKGFAISDLMVQIGRKPGVMRQGTLKTR